MIPKFIQQEELRLCKKYGCVNIDEVLIKQKQMMEDKNDTTRNS